MKNLENEKIKMVKEATKEITSLSVKIAEKILSKSIDGHFDQKTIKELTDKNGPWGDSFKDHP